MTIYVLAAAVLAFPGLYVVGLATGDVRPPRWWRRRSAARARGEQIARAVIDQKLQALAAQEREARTHG